MNWPYIAGFVDGEGSIIMAVGTGCIRPSLFIAQSGDKGKMLLQKISSWMASQGIESHIYFVPSCKKELSKLDTYRLNIGGREDVLAALRNIVPHLELKRIAAQDILRFCGLYPSLRKGKAGKALASERYKAGKLTGLKNAK